MFLIFILLLSSCTRGKDGNKTIENPISDTVSESLNIDGIVKKAPNIQDDILLEQEKTILFTHLWHPNNKLQSEHEIIEFDTIIGEWEVSTLIKESLNPKEYVTDRTGGRYYDINEQIEEYDVIYYGRNGRIVFKPMNSSEQKNDTVYINREFLTKRFPFEGKQLKNWALFSMDFKEVKNDSIIFLANLGIPDSGFGYILELKFSTHNPSESLVVEDVTDKIWPPDDEEEWQESLRLDSLRLDSLRQASFTPRDDFAAEDTGD